jgi:hypothetical protein
MDSFTKTKRKKINWAKKRKDLEKPVKALDDKRWVVLYYFFFFMMIFMECFGLYGIAMSIIHFFICPIASVIGIIFFTSVLFCAVAFYRCLCSMLKKENKKYWR